MIYELKDFLKCTNSTAEKKTGLSAPGYSDFALFLINCIAPDNADSVSKT